MKSKKYMLNKRTGKLHKYNFSKCYYSKIVSCEYKFYDTEDEAIRENQYYIGRCKNCFKGD